MTVQGHRSQKLNQGHHLGEFDCSNPSLDNWLKRFAWMFRAFYFSRQAIVFGMAPDPVPHDPVSSQDRKRPIFQANTRRVDLVLTCQFLEMQTWVGWAGTEELIGPSCILLNRYGQVVEQAPELTRGPRLHQRRSSIGTVSPLASSSRAS